MQIVDDVKSRTPEDYEAVTRAEVERLSSLPEVVAVYSTGMVKAPGISDLDLIAVLDLEKSAGRVRRQLKTAMKFSTEDYIRTHPVFAISPQLLPQMRWLADLSTLESLYGPAIEPDPLPEQYQKLLQAVITLETGLHKFFALRVLVQSPTSGTRALLLTLNSIGYSLSLAQQLESCSGELQNSIEEYRTDLLELRGHWFSLQTPQRNATLESLAGLAPRLLLQAFEVASQSLVKQGGLSSVAATGTGQVRVEPRGLVTLDMNQSQAKASLETLPWGDSSDSQSRAVLPGPLGAAISFAHYWSALDEDRARQKHLETRVQFDSALQERCTNVTEFMRTALQQRAQVMCDYAEWYRPLWTCAICFSPYTTWLMGRRSLGEKIFSKLEDKMLRFMN